MPKKAERKQFIPTAQSFRIIEGKGCLGRGFFAHIFGVCEKTLWSWTKQGIPHLTEKNYRYYPIAEALEWWLKNVYQLKESGETITRKDLAEIRKKEAEADIKELELAKVKGNLVAFEDIAKQLALRATYFKTALEEMPRSNAVEIMNCETEKEVVEFWQRCNSELLSIFSDELEVRQKDEFSKNLQKADLE